MAGHVDNTVVINAPLQAVWDITLDIENWPTLYDHEYQEATILERNGDTVRFRLSMFPDANGTVWSWVSERTEDAANHRTKSHRVETGPFEYMNIEWSYEEVDGGTKMRWVQDFHMKPAAPVNDEQMQANINRGMSHQMPHIKEQIEKRLAQKV